jgi:hypothetical protein
VSQSWRSSQTPAQQVLGLQTWRPQEKVNATWGTMFLREFAWAFLGVIPFAQLVSFLYGLPLRQRAAIFGSRGPSVSGLFL